MRNLPPYRTVHRVMRTTGRTATEVCRHRWEWTAEWCARRGEKRSGLGVHYVVFPGVASPKRPAKPQGSSVEFFCATCCASEGEDHLEWCHRPGVMHSEMAASTQIKES